MSHQGEGFPRKASVTLGSLYCSQDEGNGLFYSVPLCNSGVLSLGLALWLLGRLRQAGPHLLAGKGRGWAIRTLKNQP